MWAANTFQLTAPPSKQATFDTLSVFLSENSDAPHRHHISSALFNLRSTCEHCYVRVLTSCKGTSSVALSLFFFLDRNNNNDFLRASSNETSIR